jgi:hypothetical protein
MYKRKEPEELKSELGVDSGDGRDTLEWEMGMEGVDAFRSQGRIGVENGESWIHWGGRLYLYCTVLLQYQI